MTTLTLAESPSPGLNCELPQNIITSPCRYVEEIVNCRSGHLSAYKPSTNTVQGTSGCVIVSCRVVRVTNSQLRQSCCQISDGEHFAAQLYCVGTFGSPQNFAPTLSLPTPHLRSTTATSDKKCIVHSSHVPLHCYQPNNSKFHPDPYFGMLHSLRNSISCLKSPGRSAACQLLRWKNAIIWSTLSWRSFIFIPSNCTKLLFKL